MKIEYKPTRDEIRGIRKKEYLRSYPLEVQMEAIVEASMGRPEKLEELKRGMSQIRESLPFGEGG